MNHRSPTTNLKNRSNIQYYQRIRITITELSTSNLKILAEYIVRFH